MQDILLRIAQFISFSETYMKRARCPFRLRALKRSKWLLPIPHPFHKENKREPSSQSERHKRRQNGPTDCGICSRTCISVKYFSCRTALSVTVTVEARVAFPFNLGRVGYGRNGCAARYQDLARVFWRWTLGGGRVVTGIDCWVGGKRGRVEGMREMVLWRVGHGCG